MRPSSAAHHGTSAAAVPRAPGAVLRTAHPRGFSFVRLVSTCSACRSVPDASRGPRRGRPARTHPNAADGRAGLGGVARARRRDRDGGKRREQRVHDGPSQFIADAAAVGGDHVGGAVVEPRDGRLHRLGDGAKVERGRLRLLPLALWTEVFRTGSGEPIASSSASIATAADPRCCVPSADPPRTRLAPGDGVSKSASAVLNFFSRASSSSSSSAPTGRSARACAYLPIVRPGRRGRGHVDAVDAHVAHHVRDVGVLVSSRDFLADFGAGDSKPGFFLIGTSAIDPGTDGGAGTGPRPAQPRRTTTTRTSRTRSRACIGKGCAQTPSTPPRLAQ